MLLFFCCCCFFPVVVCFVFLFCTGFLWGFYGRICWGVLGGGVCFCVIVFSLFVCCCFLFCFLGWRGFVCWCRFFVFFMKFIPVIDHIMYLAPDRMSNVNHIHIIHRFQFIWISNLTSIHSTRQGAVVHALTAICCGGVDPLREYSHRLRNLTFSHQSI